VDADADADEVDGDGDGVAGSGFLIPEENKGTSGELTKELVVDDDDDDDEKEDDEDLRGVIGLAEERGNMEEELKIHTIK
jgi:hypothetical protein